MPRREIVPFAAAHLGDAAQLLARRHAAHRRVEPLLSERYEDPAVAADEIGQLLSAPRCSGTVAVEGSRVTGYLLGAPRPQETWGRNVWVESAGYAVEQPAVVQDLYAVAAARWVAEGAVAHYALVPALAASIDPWFRLVFGAQHVHVICAPATPRDVAAPAGVTVRRATAGDVPTLARLDPQMGDHLQGSPVFSPVPPADADEDAEAEWRGILADASYTTLVAELDGRVVGYALGCPVEQSSTHTGLTRPDGAAILGSAVVDVAARGRGVGQALGVAVLEWAAESGYRSIVTDWRSANLASARTWPPLGWRESFLRLHRLVGH